MINHSRTITFKFLGVTNTKPSRVSITDKWYSQRVELFLSGADMWATVKEYLEGRGLTIINYGWLEHSGDRGVVLCKEFDIQLKA